jgi:peptide/nickel transport system permease protein
LGLGIQPPIPSWGNMLFNAKEVIHEFPELIFFPGFLIFIVVISFNFIGDGLQNSVNPKSIQR